MVLSEKELREIAIRKYEQALERKNHFSLTTTTNNGIWKTAFIVIGFGLLVSCFGGIAYLIGQNSGKNKYNRCKC